MNARLGRGPRPAQCIVSCFVLVALLPAAGNARAADAPKHYLAWVQLGETMLEQARLTHDPDTVVRARESLQHSLELQPSFRAYLALSALSNFTHRFEDALRWSELASTAAPQDTSLLAQRVEALLGLGRLDDVERLLADAPAENFLAVASRARWHAASGRVDEAVEAFIDAVELADEAGVEELGVWARVAAGALLLDSGRADEAQPHLALAAAADPGSVLVRIHLAELLEAQGRLAEAFGQVRRLAKETGDPVLHSRAFALARQLGKPRLARRHFERAEQGFERVSEAGEIYSLEPLARLYAAAGRPAD